MYKYIVFYNILYYDYNIEEFGSKTPYQPLEIGLQNLATDIGTYFWPSSVRGLPSMAKTSTDSNKTVKCLLHLVLKTTRDRQGLKIRG